MVLADIINYLGTALGLVGLGVVAPDSVRLGIKSAAAHVRRWIGKPPTPGTWQVESLIGYATATLAAPSSPPSIDERVAGLETAMVQIQARVDHTVGEVGRASSEIAATKLQIETDKQESGRLNLFGFWPVAGSIVLGNLDELLGRTPWVAVPFIVVASGSLVYCSGWLSKRIRRDWNR